MTLYSYYLAHRGCYGYRYVSLNWYYIYYDYDELKICKHKHSLLTMYNLKVFYE